MLKIRLIISGRGYDAAQHVPAQWNVPESTTLATLIQSVQERMPVGHKLAPSCLVAVSGTHLGTLARHTPRELREGDEVVLIAPVAGG